MKKEDLVKAVREAKERAKPRNFLESVDLAINFRNIDFKRPENRIDLEVELPKGRGKRVKVAVFADKALASDLKGSGKVDRIITREELEKMGKKEGRKLAKEYDYFLAEAPLMPLIAKKLGQVLGPRRKMPKPVPPNKNVVEAMAEKLRRTVKVSNKKGKYMPVVHVPVGTVEMSDEDIAENVLAVYRAVVGKVGEQNVKSVYVKTTMGPAVRVGA